MSIFYESNILTCTNEYGYIQASRPPSRSHDRPSYRLFPSVEPTPPASPSSHRKPINRPTDPRRRSASEDAAARRTIQRQEVPVRQVAVERGRNASVPDVKHMSTVQESADSPTVPAKYISPPFVSEDEIHNRSSSAPGDHRQRPRIHMRAPSESKLRSAWTSRPTEQQPQADIGLGLTLPSTRFAPRTPRRTNPGKPKPNLRINVDHADRPPPPPPKSPRHSRDRSAASIQSGVSSMHGESPDSATVVTPGSIRAVLHGTATEPMPTPQPLQAAQASYFQTGGPIRVREVAIPRDRRQQSESSIQQPQQSGSKPAPIKIPAPNIDKPMPSLPTPAKRLSVHLREIQEAEKRTDTIEKTEKIEKPGVETSKDTTSPKDAQSSAPTDTTARNKPSSVLSNKQESEAVIQQFPQPLKGPTKPLKRDARSPTPDLGSRPRSPANSLQTANTSAKVLPILPTEGASQSRSATPDTSVTRFRPLESKPVKAEDPLQEIQNLNKQSEALHTRYASLRADRVKISTSISLALRDEKPGSEYANNLLDQHLSLNAINSSMDICFAKLKSLDCRKEEAMQAFVKQMKTQSVVSAATIGSTLAPPLSAKSGRSTPEIGPEPKSLTPEMIPTSTFFSTGTPKPDSTQQKDSPSQRVDDAKQDPPETEKRITIIRASTHSAGTSSSSEPMPGSPMSSIHDMYSTKRIRIKGAKAAKILGLVAQSACSGESGKGITLPDRTPGMPGAFRKPIAVEVEIQERPVERKATSTSQPEKKADATTSPSTVQTGPKMPKRKPPPTPTAKHDTKDSVSSSVASSQTESSPEEPEVQTPTGSDGVPFGLKSAKRGMLQTFATTQTIQVFVDDVDILDYYHTGVH